MTDQEHVEKIAKAADVLTDACAEARAVGLNIQVEYATDFGIVEVTIHRITKLYPEPE